eukprot:195296_1
MSRKRRCKKPPPVNPSFYVGYVEDEETPEQIMKKFAALEALKRKKQDEREPIEQPPPDPSIPAGKAEAPEPPPEEPLTERDLDFLFEQTSMFTPASLQRQSELEHAQSERLRRELRVPEADWAAWGGAAAAYWALGAAGAFGSGTSSAFGDVPDEIDWAQLVEDAALEEEAEREEEDIFDANIDIPLDQFSDFNLSDEDVISVTKSDDDLSSEDEHAKLAMKLGFSDDESPRRSAAPRVRRVPRRSGKPVARRVRKHKSRSRAYTSAAPSGRKQPSAPVDPLMPTCTRIPVPLTRGWALPIHPLGAALPAEGIPEVSCYSETDLFALDLHNFVGGSVQGILIDPPWQLPHLPPSPGKVVPNDLKRLSIPFDLAPNAVLFIWTEKQYTHEVVRLMKSWEFIYIETMVWIKKNINNRFAAQPSTILNRSKATMLMFRRKWNPARHGGQKEPDEAHLELRHQRTSDVFCDFIRRDKETGEELKPDEFTHKLVETLLPTSMRLDQLHHPTLLELWARPGKRRPGWASVVNKAVVDSV